MNTLSQILEGVQALSPGERQQLVRHLQQALPAPKPLLSEEEFVVRMQELGILDRNESFERSVPAPLNFEPAPTVGQPASEVIIEERRDTKIHERAGRAQDKESEDAFEKLRRDGHT